MENPQYSYKRIALALPMGTRLHAGDLLSIAVRDTRLFVITKCRAAHGVQRGYGCSLLLAQQVSLVRTWLYSSRQWGYDLWLVDHPLTPLKAMNLVGLQKFTFIEHQALLPL